MPTAADNHRYELGWLEANDRIKSNHLAAQWIARQYSDWKTGRRTAVCAAAMNTSFWQRAVSESAHLFA